VYHRLKVVAPESNQTRQKQFIEPILSTNKPNNIRPIGVRSAHKVSGLRINKINGLMRRAATRGRLTVMPEFGSFVERCSWCIVPAMCRIASLVLASNHTTNVILTKYAAGITVPKKPTKNAIDTRQKRLCFICRTGMNGVSFFNLASTVRRVRDSAIPIRVVAKSVQAIILRDAIRSTVLPLGRPFVWTHFSVCFTPTALIIGGTIWENTAAPNMSGQS
jgi:hypothetical protein